MFSSSSFCCSHFVSKGNSRPPSKGQDEAGIAPASRRRPFASAHSTNSAAIISSAPSWSSGLLSASLRSAVASSAANEEGRERSAADASKRPVRAFPCKRPQRRSYAAATSLSVLPLGRPTRLQNSMQNPRTRPTLGAKPSQASTRPCASAVLGATKRPSPRQRWRSACRRSASGMTEGARSSQVMSSTTRRQWTREPRLGVRSWVLASGSAMKFLSRTSAKLRTSGSSKATCSNNR
mmetsp:Transcript_41940/g.110693  ORF Transcript_41940/g.110693 Transcript_41940/m.110693 type:complete len:237 (-) Transcript_41940:863-1573(-)